MLRQCLQSSWIILTSFYIANLDEKPGISSSVKSFKTCYSKAKIDIFLPGLIAGQAYGKHVFPSKTTAHRKMGGCTS